MAKISLECVDSAPVAEGFSERCALPRFRGDGRWGICWGSLGLVGGEEAVQDALVLLGCFVGALIGAPRLSCRLVLMLLAAEVVFVGGRDVAGGR